MARINFSGAVQKIQDEVKLVFGTLKDKGTNRFGRMLIIAFALPFTAHFLVYTPAKKKMGEVAGKLEVSRNTAKHADTYKDLRDRLNQTYSQLPSRERPDFLSDMIKEALRAEGIVSTSFNPPMESLMTGGVVQSVGINIRVKFPELMAFLARVEANKPAIHVSTLDIVKKETPIGINDVSCSLSTIVLTERY